MTTPEAPASKPVGEPAAAHEPTISTPLARRSEAQVGEGDPAPAGSGEGSLLRFMDRTRETRLVVPLHQPPLTPSPSPVRRERVARALAEPGEGFPYGRFMVPTRGSQTVEAAYEPPVVWITGAAGGFGRALVRTFADRGWRVAASGHATAPRDAGAEVLCGRLDVTDRRQVVATLRTILERWGRVDALINNAGVKEDCVLVRMDDPAWDRVLDVNLKGAFLCAQAVLEPMLAQGGGHILNIASFAGRTGAVGQANYTASKAGLVGFTLSLAREVGPQGVCVNAVLPGAMHTGMTAALPSGVWDGFRGASVLGKVNEPAAVAPWLVELAGNRSISGQVLQLDGRITRWT